MKTKALFVAAGLFASILAGCGGDGGRGTTPTVFVSEILSDLRVDGYVSEDLLGALTLSPALTAGRVNVGVNPSTFIEHRGFLHFPLEGNVPGDAVVTFAFVEVFVNSVQVPPVPILVDMVEFPPPLITTDYYRVAPAPFLPAVATIGPVPVPASAAFGPPVQIDVTDLVQLAIDRGDTSFQIRLLLDLGSAAGMIEIDDAAAQTAPLLHVEYF